MIQDLWQLLTNWILPAALGIVLWDLVEILTAKKRIKNLTTDSISALGPRQQFLARLSDPQIDLLEEKLRTSYFRNPDP
jgi:hypothetical protein